MDLTSNDSENLLPSLRKGDEKAFLKLYEDYYGKLCVYLLNFTQNKEVIEDVVQDTFIKIWANRKTLLISKSISSYLYRAVYNNYIDSYRKEKQQKSLLDAYLYTALNHYLEYDEEYRNQLLKKLQECIDLLPEKCRDVFIRIKLKDMKYKEVTLAMNISQKTIEGHIRRAYFYIKDCVNPIC